jgi:flagellar hook-associated protein 1
MGIGILATGNSAMSAAYTQLQVTAHNIANANTPGYTRQEAIVASAGANFTGGGYIGRGVETSTVRRNYDLFLTQEVRQTQAQAAGTQVRAHGMARIDRLFGDGSLGLGAAMDELASAWGDVVNRPFDSAARGSVLARAQTLTQRVASFDQQLGQIAQDSDTRIIQSSQSLNPMLEKLAKLNDQLAGMLSNRQPPNDLLDQRDQLVSEINKKVRTVSYENPDGTVNLFTAGGDALVLGNKASTFGARTDPIDGSLQVTLNVNGNSLVQTAGSLGGGELSGLLQFRDQDLAQIRAGVGQLVGSMAWSMNQIQTSGTDLQGNAAAPLFAVGAPQVIGAANNTGSAILTATVNDGTALQASDYQITLSGGQYNVTRLKDHSTSSFASLPAQIDGLRLNLAGGLANNGDSFLLRSASAFTSGFKLNLTQPSQLAAGMAMTAVSAPANTGTLGVDAFTVQAGGVANRATVTLSFTSTGSFDVTGAGTGNPSGMTFTAGGSISFNGWTVSLNGTPKPGDVITIAPVAQASADNRNAQRMLDLFSQPSAGGSTFTGGYANLVSEVGVLAQSSNDSFTLASSLQSNAQSAQSEVSGVNLDEEAARMIQFQQAYQAAAKLIATGQKMFETLMDSMR